MKTTDRDPHRPLSSDWTANRPQNQPAKWIGTILLTVAIGFIALGAFGNLLSSITGPH